MVTVAAGLSHAAELQWQSPRAAAKKPSKPVAAQRFVRPRSTHGRVDIDVRQAAFELEPEGPQFTAASDDELQLKSVVVDRQDPFESERSAQLPQSGTGTDATGSGGQQDTDSQLQEQLRDPFGQPQQPLPGTDLPDEMSQSQNGQVLQPDGQQFQPTDQQPPEPGPAPFQPVLPPAGETVPPLGDDVPTPSADRLEEEGEQFEQACEQSIANLKTKTIGTVNVSIAVSGTVGQDFPFECSLDTGEWHAGRAWHQTTYLWKASALCHKPLYFEDEQLERYGHSWPPCFQPFVSGAHFFTRLPILPYCMGVEPPHECIYALGHYRPSSCAPYMCNPIPLSPRGALFQAGAAVGAAAVLP